ncbi:MAG TPA: vitamin K epoxide reductase family protein, partial [Dehalococcoidia bacterium]
MSAAVLGLSIAGIAVAAYLTSVHYASAPLACSTRGVIDCEQVLTSRYSEVLGIPWSVGGIIWFTISGLLAAAVLT